jgi:hypothetical protein
MWVAVARSGIALVVLTFLAWLVRVMLDEIVPYATSGTYGSASSVTRVAGYFGALTVENLTLLGALAVGVFLLGRAAVERNLG